MAVVFTVAGAVGVTVALAETGEGTPSSEDVFVPQFKPTLDVHKTTGSIRIDGDLTDPGWTEAARALNFAEVDPGDQVKPPVESESWVTYDDDNVYFALIAYDDPEAVRVSLRDRDNIFRDDYFGVMLDTYGDRTWGYELFVNPLGIQGDLRMLSDGNEDITFDLVWYSQGMVTDRGYQVEIAVPFSSLRFPDREEQTWRVNFWRDHQRDIRRRYAWSAMNRDDPCFMCNWGTLTGIRGIHPGTNLDLIGSALGYQAGRLSDPGDPNSHFDNDSPDASFGLNVRYGLTTSSSAEVTLNPDFSQVESDAGQIDINSPFALFYPERRPFFQEGSDLYDTWISAIYTRSINDPDGAAKFTGTFGRTSVLYLGGYDDNSPVILPGEDRSFFRGAETSVSNIARVRRTYAEDSFVGALITDRRFTGDSGGAGTVLGIDGRHRISQNLQLEYQITGSHTEEPEDTLLTSGLNDISFGDGAHTLAFDGESYWGHAGYFSLERGGRTWSFDFDYWEYSPTFRTDNGFTTRNNYHQVIVWNGYTFRPNGAFLINWSPSVNVGRIWRQNDNAFEDEWIQPQISLDLVGQTYVWLDYLTSRERFGADGEVFDGIQRWTIGAESRPVEWISGGAEVNFGRTIYRDFDDPALGKNYVNLSVWNTLKATQRLVIESNVDFSRLDHPDGRELFEGFILRSRLNYQFTRELFLRTVVQFDNFSDRLDIEPLLTYRVNPFTVFFVGLTGGYRRFEDAPRDGSGRDEWSLTDRQFFAKLQYLFRR